MTVDTTVNTVTATGDNTTTEFSFPYLVYDSSHVKITLDGIETSAWSATGYGNAAGITITFDTAPATGVSIIIQRIVPNTQDTDLENFDGNPSDVTEKQFDLLVMADQQLDENLDRAILTPIGTSLTSNVVSGTIDTTTRILTLTTSGPSTKTLADISTSLDTVITSETTGDLLRYDGTNWVNVAQLDTTNIADGAITVGKLDSPTGSDSNVVTGTAGTASNFIMWNADGDAVDSTKSASDFATSAQGTLADTAVQPADMADPLNRPILSNNTTDSDHDIDITAGARLAADGSKVLKLSSALTKQLDASWAAGNNAGGLSSSLTLSVDTWYHVFLIEVDGSVDVGFDTDVSAANLIADHSATAYRRIGSVLTDATSNILPFLQTANRIEWETPVMDVDTTSGTTHSDVTLSVPPGVKVTVHGSLYVFRTNGLAAALLTDPDLGITSAANYPSEPGATVMMNGNTSLSGRAIGQFDIVSNTSSQVRLVAAYTSTDTKVYTYGWTDTAI